METQPQNQPYQSQVPPSETGHQVEQQKISGLKDTDQSKLWAILGYIFPVLFFIPLIQEGLKNNSYSRFHANQQSIILIIQLTRIFVLNFVFSYINFFGMGLISFAVNIIVFILIILGIISAVKGEVKPLPLIKGIKIIS